MSKKSYEDTKLYNHAEMELKLFLNRELFEAGIITSEMYEKSVELIYKSASEPPDTYSATA